MEFFHRKIIEDNGLFEYQRVAVTCFFLLGIRGSKPFVILGYGSVWDSQLEMVSVDLPQENVAPPEGLRQAVGSAELGD